jgi:DNA-binding NarL/FixJ family response regulator
MAARATSGDETILADAPAIAVPRVIVASGVLLYREGLAASLVCDGRLHVLAKVGVVDAVDTVAAHRPDAVLVDATIEEGRLLARRLHAARPKTPLIGFGISGDSSSFIACAEAGFSAFVGCHGTIDNLVTAVVGALRGELACTPRFASMLCDRLAALASEQTKVDDPLTPRERQVAALVVEGRSNKEIALVLRIGPATVKNHVHNILDKLKICRRAGIASRLDRAVA